MSDREKIKKAIVSLQELRPQLGDHVVETTIRSLQEQLTQLQKHNDTGHLPRTDQRKQVTILFANLIGFQELTETIPDTALLNTINLIWSRLDQSITNQEGIIDKHMGNTVMGLFGVPAVREDDPERAIRAALDMRNALNSFITEFSPEANGESPSELSDKQQKALQKLRLRVGINTGPVLLGGVGVGDEYTVIGDAVNIASRLENVAPEDGILIAHDTYRMIKEIFHVEPQGAVKIRGRAQPVEAHLVLGLKPRHFYAQGRGLEGVETRMIGRDREIKMLIEAYRNTQQTRVGRHIRIIGEAGIGKSRLIHEFRNWVRAQEGNIQILKARTYLQSNQMPYALIRDLLATHFGIQDNEPAAAAEQKLVSGIRKILDSDETEIQKRAQVIGQLIGLDINIDSLNAAVDPDESLEYKEQAFDFITDLLKAMMDQHEILLIFLEDMHWADDGSIALLQQLSNVCLHSPLIIISLTRPANLDLFTGTSPFNNPNTIINLKTLSPQMSRDLVQEILKKLPHIPTDLVDLIVNRAEGNPFFIEEIIKVLIEDGVIVVREPEWELRKNQLKSVRMPPHISGVLQARLDRLSEGERTVLQRAAVVGRIFWDTAVLAMNESDKPALTPAQIITALQALEKRELIYSRPLSGFAGAQAYVFKHALLAQITYESILLRQRPLYHYQVAEWYVTESKERIAEYAGLIAEHYESAGENRKAAELYELAATRAQTAFNSAIAMANYRKSLSLLADKSHYAVWQIRLQTELAGLLRRQARLVEAAQTFILMRYTAEEDGDLNAQARAWNGLALVQQLQTDFHNAEKSAKEAERVAWLISADSELVRALQQQAQIFNRFGQKEEAAAAATRALDLSEKLPEPELFAQTVQTYAHLLLQWGDFAQFNPLLKQLQDYIALQDMLDSSAAKAAASLVLGELFARVGQFDQAGRQLLVALNQHRRLENQEAISTILHIMGETARRQGNARAALPLYRKSLSLANTIGDRYRTLVISLNLGAALLDLKNYRVAHKALLQVKHLTENISRMAGWVHKPELFALLAAAELGLGQPLEALADANTALSAAQALDPAGMPAGIAWKQLGTVLAKLPPQQLPYKVHDVYVDPVDCFNRSLAILENWCGGGPASHPEQIQTLLAWQTFEEARGNKGMAAELRGQLRRLATPLGIGLP
jgi:predicted ATPase/class 3 adenylate cyclase